MHRQAWFSPIAFQQDESIDVYDDGAWVELLLLLQPADHSFGGQSRKVSLFRLQKEGGEEEDRQFEQGPAAGVDSRKQQRKEWVTNGE